MQPSVTPPAVGTRAAQRWHAGQSINRNSSRQALQTIAAPAISGASRPHAPQRGGSARSTIAAPARRHHDPKLGGDSIMPAF
jgi:hypothetical protein